MKKIYSGFFWKDGLAGDRHVTWEFNPGVCRLPDGVEDGDLVDILIKGMYQDDEVECLIVEVQLPDGTRLLTQPGGTLLHITTRADGVSPVESGRRATARGWDPVRERRVKARAGFFIK